MPERVTVTVVLENYDTVTFSGTVIFTSVGTGSSVGTSGIRGSSLSSPHADTNITHAEATNSGNTNLNKERIDFMI